VITTSGAAMASSEGCLSFRSVQWQVRCKPIASFTGVDDDWKPINLHANRLTPLEVSCLQHEAEHLSGILMTDRMKHTERDKFMRKVSKAARLPAPPPPAPLPQALQQFLK
jgi:peptide deformylase